MNVNRMNYRMIAVCIDACGRYAEAAVSTASEKGESRLANGK